MKRFRKAMTGWLSGMALLCLSPFSALHAAPVAIDTLSVGSAALTVAITDDGTYSFSGPVVPPAVIDMGTYQDPIVGGTVDGASWKIYSTGAYGKPAPSGTVDGAAGTIDVDFSSLRGNVALPVWGTLDFELWPLVLPPSAGTYDAATNAFTLAWGPEDFSVSTDHGTASGTATVTLGGTATPVPVPAAIWLLGSGLLGLAGVTRRKQAK